MNESFLKHISQILKEEITGVQSISGGDISEANKLSTTSKSYFLKLNKNPHGHKMFEEEAKGLTAIGNTEVIATPEIIGYGDFDGNSYLILEYIEQKSPAIEDLFLFGENLAKMHGCSNVDFGWDSDNFIGSLPQYNKTFNSWSQFYYHQRLKPQLDLAKKQSKLTIAECPPENILLENLSSILGNLTPSLLHGDLWSGNYLISKSGKAYLIDPATYFGHSEVDIAMSLLFGGFGDPFYEGYFNIKPKNSGIKERIELYQLYYLLVHLNLFGMSYKGSVMHILNSYF